MPQKVEVSHRTIIFTILFLLSLWLLYQIRSILLILFVGVILTAALNPLLEKMERIKIPRGLGIILIYLLIFLFFGLVLAGIIPPLVNQTTVFVSRIPDYFDALGLGVWGDQIIDAQIQQLLGRLGQISVDIVRVSINVFGNFLSVLVLMLISFYLLLERKKLDSYLLSLFGPANYQRASLVINKIEKRLGHWFRAQLLLMIVVGVMTYIGLRFLGIDFALPLALLAAILEVIPNLGPTIAAIPGVLAGLTISPWMGLAVAILYLLIQQLENQLIVPQLMAREVGLNPLVTIIALVIGFRLGGTLGIILALPSVILLETLITELSHSEHFKKA